MHTTGISLMLELFDCPAAVFADDRALERAFEGALSAAGFDTVDHLAHHFPGQGLTLVVILRQSHAVLHTWPERSYISIDVYSCGEFRAVRPALEGLAAGLARALSAVTSEMKLIERGA